MCYPWQKGKYQSRESFPLSDIFLYSARAHSTDTVQYEWIEKHCATEYQINNCTADHSCNDFFKVVFSEDNSRLRTLFFWFCLIQCEIQQLWDLPDLKF
jgi:hypothetical protein